MNGTSIVQTLQQQLDPAAIQQIGQTLGTDPRATASAISMALPILLGGLSHNAASPQGAAALDTALASHDGSILDSIGGMLAGGGGGIGGAILGHILGARRGPVEQGVGRATGMNAEQVGQLLMMLAPIVMGVLGRAKQQGGLGPSQLPEVLNQSKTAMEQHAPETAGLGGLFDMNHDGNIADDVARIGSSMLGGLFGRKS